MSSNSSRCRASALAVILGVLISFAIATVLIATTTARRDDSRAEQTGLDAAPRVPPPSVGRASDDPKALRDGVESAPPRIAGLAHSRFQCPIPANLAPDWVGAFGVESRSGTRVDYQEATFIGEYGIVRLYFDVVLPTTVIVGPNHNGDSLLAHLDVDKADISTCWLEPLQGAVAVRGHVVSVTDGRSVAFATVAGCGHQARTDRDGNFSLTADALPCSVSVSCPGVVDPVSGPELLVTDTEGNVLEAPSWAVIKQVWLPAELEDAGPHPTASSDAASGVDVALEGLREAVAQDRDNRELAQELLYAEIEGDRLTRATEQLFYPDCTPARDIR